MASDGAARGDARGKVAQKGAYVDLGVLPQLLLPCGKGVLRVKQQIFAWHLGGGRAADTKPLMTAEQKGAKDPHQKIRKWRGMF